MTSIVDSCIGGKTGINYKINGLTLLETTIMQTQYLFITILSINFQIENIFLDYLK